VEGVLEFDRKGIQMLGDEVHVPNGDIRRQEGNEVRTSGKDFVRVQINPSARRRVAGVHGDLLQGSDGSLEGGSVVPSKSADVIGTKDRNEKVKFAMVEEFV
jgi:hypothetical protein